MSKNDWRAGDDGGRSEMNAPLWIASGVVNGAGDPANSLRLYFTPGWVRFPIPYWDDAGQRHVVGSGQAQSMVLAGALSNTYYTVFLRSDGTLMVSGNTTSSAAGFAATPRWNAEPIGQVFVAGSLAQANLKGPWEQGTFGKYEGRGQYVAINTAAPRAIFVHRGSSASETEPPPFLGSIYVQSHGTYANASGLAFLTFQPQAYSAVGSQTSTNQPFHPRTHLHATVTWMPSGASAATPGGSYEPNALTMTAEFFWVPAGANPSVASNRIGTWIARQRHYSTVGLNPWLTRSQATQYATAAFGAVSPLNESSVGGYVLYVKLDTALTDAGAGACSMVITQVHAIARPAVRSSQLVEPNDL